MNDNTSFQEIQIEDLAKVQLVVVTILSVEEIPKAKKLYKFLLDLGQIGQRQIVGGIKLAYTPDQLIGTQILVVANLAPRVWNS